MMLRISAWLRIPSQRRTSGQQTAGIREVSRMPKGGKNRQSGRDDPRGGNLAGGLGDEDYEWIRYLGEGRSSSGASSSHPPSQSPVPAVAAARPAPPPQRVKRGGRPQPYDSPGGNGAPVGRDTSGQGFGGRGSLVGPDDGGWPGRDFGRRGPGPGPDDRRERPARDRRQGRRSRPGRAEHPSWPEQQIGYADEQPLPAEPPPPGDGRVRRPAGRGRAVKVRSGRTTDMLFNPAAEDYGQPLYPPADGQRPGGLQQDWQRPDWESERRLDTAEYARPLYPYHDAGPATDSRPRRSWPDDDPFLDTDSRPRLVPGERRPALPPGRSARGGSPGRGPALPEPQDLTIPPGRRGVPPVLLEPQDLKSRRRRRGTPPALARRADRTGLQRQLSDLDLADRPAESGMGFAPGSARSRRATAEYSVSDLARDSSSQAPDPQVTATLAPPRSP